MAERLQRACSGPPESDSPSYACGPGAANVSGVRTVLPEDSPYLTPKAAVVLFRILIKAYERLAQEAGEGS